MTGFMEAAFYIAAAVAIVSTVLTITRLDAVHALLYLIVSLLAVAVVFYTMGAPLVAALEVIIYAGAIVVLFVFVVMMLNLGAQARDRERQWLAGKIWVGPVLLSAILLAEVIYLIVARRDVWLDRRRCGSETSGDRALRSLSDWRGTGFHAAAGRSGRQLAIWGGPHPGESGGSMMTANSDGPRADSGGNLVRAGAGRAADAP